MLKYVMGAALMAAAFSFTTMDDAEARAACRNGQILRVSMGRCVSKQSRAAAGYVHVARAKHVHVAKAKRARHVKLARAHQRHERVAVKVVVREKVVYRTKVVEKPVFRPQVTAIKASANAPAIVVPPPQTRSPFGSLVPLPKD